MRTSSRILSAVIALGASFPLGMPTAYAEDVSALAPYAAAWFWDKQTTTVPVVGVGMPAPVPTQLSNVDTDRFAVAYQGGKETTPNGDIAAPEKELYIQWDIFDLVEAGSTIDSFVITLPLDPGGETNDVYEPGKKPDLIACKPLGGFGSGYGDAFISKPLDDCSEAVFGAYDAAKKAYVFDLTTYAQDWVDQDNFGIAIRPRTDETIPYQLQFKGSQDLLANFSFTPPPVIVDAPTFEEPTVVDPAPVDTGSVSQPDLGGYVIVPQPRAQAPAAPRRPVVVVDAPRPIRRVAATPFVESFGLTNEFWAAALLGVVLLGVTSLILGDERVMVREAGKDSTLDRVLRERQAGLGTAPAARPRTRVRTV